MTPTTLAGFPSLTADGDRTRPPILFLHGAFAPHESWSPWMDHLTGAGWRSIAVSRRGRLGIGPDKAEGLRIADYVEDTLQVIAALGEAPVLIGHSMGGLIAQKVAEQGQAAAMVLLASAPPAMLTAQAVALPAYLPMMPSILLGQPILPDCSGCTRIALNRVPEAERAAIHDGFHHESGLAYREMIFGTVRVDATRVRVPTCVIGGKEDRVVSQALVRWTAAHYGTFPRFYEGHAHWLVGEPGWERIADDVTAWLDPLAKGVRAAG